MYFKPAATCAVGFEVYIRSQLLLQPGRERGRVQEGEGGRVQEAEGGRGYRRGRAQERKCLFVCEV